MATEIEAAEIEANTTHESTNLRLWPAVLIVVAMWAATKGTELLAPGTMLQFMSGFFAPQVATVLLLLWWLFGSRVSWRQRWIGAALIVGLIVAGFLLSDESMFMSLLMFTIPWLATAIVGLLLLKFVPWTKRRWLPVAATVVMVAIAMTLRLDGLSGSFEPELSWRWDPTREEVFLTQSQDASVDAVEQTLQLPAELTATDWPEFRGPARDGSVAGVTFPIDWEASPPRELWRREVGPGWGSFTVVGDTIFTQEQRGEQEVVTAYHAKTGELVWMNEVESRFTEVVGGPGPRATPTYHEGKLYTQGAGGKIQCLDAATGEAIWVRDLTVDTPAKPPQWGFSASPLVVDNLVITYAGAGDGQSIVAYKCEDGEIAWMGGKGTHSYSSPQLATFDGVPQVLMISNYGLISFSPTDGKPLWEHEWDLGAQPNRVVQPLVLGDDVLIGTFLGLGTRRITVTHEDDQWDTTEQWTSRHMKPYFNDYVEHEGYLYGFDNEIFACVDLETGKKKWKRGRYGHGQVLLVKDLDALLVLGEQGELVLLGANPKKHTELAKLQALDGKTWNHPVIAGNLLFVRNGVEAVCYELSATLLTRNRQLAEDEAIAYVLKNDNLTRDEFEVSSSHEDGYWWVRFDLLPLTPSAHFSLYVFDDGTIRDQDDMFAIRLREIQKRDERTVLQP